MTEIYCCIRGEGSDEYWGEGRTYYKYYLVDNVFEEVCRATCNSSMGTMSMNDFALTYFGYSV